MGRNSRARRRLAAAGAGVVTSIEFAGLLDPVGVPAARPLPAAIHSEPAAEPVVLAELVTEPVPEPALAAVSRFAGSGIDDDRLPLHDTKKRSRRH